MKTVHTSGTRKRAKARATLKKGTGRIRLNKVLLQSLNMPMIKAKIMEPLFLAGNLVNGLDISITIDGGGVNSQIEAARVALCRGLVQVDKKLEKIFLEYDRGFLIPDVRLKEASKPNRHGKARAKRQKSYR